MVLQPHVDHAYLVLAIKLFMLWYLEDIQKNVHVYIYIYICVNDAKMTNYNALRSPSSSRIKHIVLDICWHQEMLF